jgi:hypothetical protein
VLPLVHFNGEFKRFLQITYFGCSWKRPERPKSEIDFQSWISQFPNRFEMIISTHYYYVVTKMRPKQQNGAHNLRDLNDGNFHHLNIRVPTFIPKWWKKTHQFISLCGSYMRNQIGIETLCVFYRVEKGKPNLKFQFPSPVSEIEY